MPYYVVKNRRDTAENWKTHNPTLEEGALGFEKDTMRIKIGDGTTPWNDHKYVANVPNVIIDDTLNTVQFELPDGTLTTPLYIKGDKGDTGDPGDIPVDALHAAAAAMPTHYARDVLFSIGSTTTAQGRVTLQTPSYMTVNVGGTGLALNALTSLDLNASATWDAGSAIYATAANRAGYDFCIYACNDGGGLKILLSRNTTYPTGTNTAGVSWDATTTRKIGGFHCVCADVGTINGHMLSDFIAGDILPCSIWDLWHRPSSAPEGMVYVSGIDKWADIYLSSVSGGELVSQYGGTIADGTSAEAFHWYKFDEWYGDIKKALPTQHDFVALSKGSNQATNISTSADPETTGGHNASNGQRMVSNCGCEDACGVAYQAGNEPGGGQGASEWLAATDGNDYGIGGKHFLPPDRLFFGGHWASDVYCGSRCVSGGCDPLVLNSYFAARGVSNNRTRS